jgi:hypothetical protein
MFFPDYSNFRRSLCDLIHTFSDGRNGEIRPFVLWVLPGRFFDPFYYSADFLVSVVEDRALVLK